MADKIEPALSAEEWKQHGIQWHANGQSWKVICDGGEGPELFIGTSRTQHKVSRPHAILALANAALPDSDPRKITRAKIALLWESIDIRRAESSSRDPENEAGHLALMELHDTLESYLPPEPT